MAYRETNDLEVPSDMKLSRLSTPSQISSYIKKLIKATQYDYRESEALEVSEVLLNNPENRDSIRGTFIVSGEDPGIVKSLMPHITAVPVVGEHVVCTEYNGRTKGQDTIIPVEISVFEDRSFSFILKTSPTSVLIRKAANISSGSAEPDKIKVAEITQEQLTEIAQTKLPDLNTKSLESAKRIIEGTAKNMGIVVI